MILGFLCLLITACCSDFFIKFTALRFAFLVRFCLSRIELLLDCSSPVSLPHRVFGGIVLLLVLRVGVRVLSQVGSFDSKEIMRFLCEIREKSSDHLRIRDDLRLLGSLPKSKPCRGYDRVCDGDRDRDEDDNDDDDGDDGEDYGECYPEDEEYDVLLLRRLVKKERRRADVACKDLDKERMAAATAIDEAMAMIVRLQGEKSASEVAAKQEHRLAEQKQAYDQEVIQSLRWMLAMSEERREVLEGRMRRWGRKLNMSDDDENVEEEEEDEGDGDVVMSGEGEEVEGKMKKDKRSLMAEIIDDQHDKNVIISSLEFDSMERYVD